MGQNKEIVKFLIPTDTYEMQASHLRIRQNKKNKVEFVSLGFPGGLLIDNIPRHDRKNSPMKSQ